MYWRRKVEEKGKRDLCYNGDEEKGIIRKSFINTQKIKILIDKF